MPRLERNSERLRDTTEYYGRRLLETANVSDLNPFPWCSECASWHAPGHHLPDVSSDLAGQLRAKNAEVHTLLLKLDAVIDQLAERDADLSLARHDYATLLERWREEQQHVLHWRTRTESAESRLGALQKAIEADLSDAKAVCGGDGEGCETYRGYYDSAERRHRKCGQCPMDAIFHARRALASLDVAVLKGDRFTGTDCDFYEPGNGDACMNCGTTHESPAVERQGNNSDRPAYMPEDFDARTDGDGPKR